ncbi:transcriptional regulator, HxlR family [Actinopolyspora mzabensis]|uniref:Transcriptional regulator, HxlR family n=1 Tax=Actinopolyspora mzabensis TaxID=995066 RepID=A0A1G8Z6W6_ACTMZ|nr:helix-turn-helix domain-containing protein [Actinopolyspora mzabensis]SDK10404.1 transcriptional regulator, HxlR family [Actinopolyspora mzabensis]
MGLGRGYSRQDCSLAHALEALGERWTLLVLRDCFYGVRQFKDFQAHLDIPRAVLADRLKTLTARGALERREHSNGVHYLLTEQGMELWPAIFSLAQWGERWLSPHGSRRVFSHADCDTDLEATGHCPTCGAFPGPGELLVREGPGADPTLRDDRVSAALRRGPHRLLTNPFPEPDYAGTAGV